MFSIAYLFAALLAAVPLGLTLLQVQAGKAISLHQIYGDLLRIGAVILAIILLEIGFRISAQNYWFGELGQQYRYWLALGLRTGIFVVVFVVAGTFVGGNLSALVRGLPGVPRSAPWVAGFLSSAIVAYGSIELWVPLLAFFGARPSGAVDPVFQNDLSFYLLVLPLYDGLVSVLSFVLIVTILAWVIGGWLLYQRLVQPRGSA